FLPLTIEPARDADNEPRFGVQMSGYSAPDPGGRSASVTLTYTIHAPAGEVAVLSSALRVPVDKLLPLPDVSMQVRLVTADQRLKGMAFSVIDNGTTSVGATRSLNFDLSTLDAGEVSDFFGANTGRGGLLFAFSVPGVTDAGGSVVIP